MFHYQTRDSPSKIKHPLRITRIERNIKIHTDQNKSRNRKIYDLGITIMPLENVYPMHVQS